MAMFAGDSPWPQSAFRTEMKAPTTPTSPPDTPGGEAMGYAGISMLGGRAPTKARSTPSQSIPNDADEAMGWHCCGRC